MDQLVHQHRQARSASPNRYRNGHRKAYRTTTSRSKVLTTTSRRSISRDAKLRRSSSSPQRPKRNKRVATTNHKTPLLGEVVEVRILSSYQLGIVRYHGQKINCKKPKQRVIGIELYKHVGNSDGTYEGESYFRPKYGGGFAHFVDESITPVRVISSAELYFCLTNAVSQKKELGRVNKRQKEEIEKLQADVATAKNDLREYFDMSKDYHELYTRSEEEKQRLKQDNEKLRVTCQRLEREMKLLRDQKFFMSRDFSESERNFDHLKNMVKKSDTDLWVQYKRSLERVKSRPRIILPGTSSQRKQQQIITKPNKSQSSDCMKNFLEDDEPQKPEKQPQILRMEQQEQLRHCALIPDDSSDTFIINEEKDDEEMSQSHALHAHEQPQRLFRHPREETTIIRRDSGGNPNECRSRDRRREECQYSSDDLIERPIHVEDWFMCDSPRVTFKDDRLNHTQVEITESSTVYGNMTVTTATSSSHQSFTSSNNVIVTPDMSPLSTTRRTPVIRRKPDERGLPREQSEIELLDRETTMTDLFDVYCGPRDESFSL